MLFQHNYSGVAIGRLFFSLIAFSNLILIGGIRLSAKDSFFIFPECADTEQILERQVLRERLGSIFLPADRGIEPRMAG